MKTTSKFTRIGNDLHVQVKIKFYQLLFGLNKYINYLDKRKLFINIPKFLYTNLDEDLLYSKKRRINKNGNMILHAVSIDNIDTSF